MGFDINKDGENQGENKKNKGFSLDKEGTGSDEKRSSGFALDKDDAGSDDEKSGGFALDKDDAGSDDKKSGGFTLDKDDVGSDDKKSGGFALDKDDTGSDDKKSGGFALDKDDVGSDDKKSGGFTLDKDDAGSEDKKSDGIASEKDVADSGDKKSGGLASDKNATATVKKPAAESKKETLEKNFQKSDETKKSNHENQSAPKVVEPLSSPENDDKGSKKGLVVGLLLVAALVVVGFFVFGGGDNDASHVQGVNDLSTQANNTEGEVEGIVGSENDATNNVADDASQSGSSALDSISSEVGNDGTKDVMNTSPSTSEIVNGDETANSAGAIAANNASQTTVVKGDVTEASNTEGEAQGPVGSEIENRDNVADDATGLGSSARKETSSDVNNDGTKGAVNTGPMISEGEMENIPVISFSQGSASEIRDENSVLIEKIVIYLNSDPSKKLVVYGYASSEGDVDVNQRISKARADKFASLIRSKGITSSRIRTVGKGIENPIASNDSEQGRQKNRRVEISFE